MLSDKSGLTENWRYRVCQTFNKLPKLFNIIIGWNLPSAMHLSSAVLIHYLT